MTIRRALFVLFAVVLLVLGGPASAETNVNTVCGNPQWIGPPQSGAGSTVAQVAVAWNGREYGVLWIDSSGSALRFQRVYADGTAAAPMVTVGNAWSTYRIDIVWNGSGYGIAYTYDYAGYSQVYFQLLNSAGASLGSSVRVSQAGISPSRTAYHPQLAFNGTSYLVTFFDSSASTGYDTYATALSAGGTILVSDLVVANTTGNQAYPVVTAAKGSGRFVIAWADGRSGRDEVYTAYVTPSNWAVTSNGVAVASAGSASFPTLADTAGVVGLAWLDTRDGANREAYFTTLNALGVKVGSEARMTNDSYMQEAPQLLWLGGEFGLFYRDPRFGLEVWYQRVSSAGAALGSAVQVSLSGGVGPYEAAFANHGFLVSFAATGYPNQNQPLGCSSPLAPTCPEVPTAYSITGTTDTTGWLSGTDNYTDIAYYQVFRNAVQVSVTANTYYNDSGLSPGTQYQYNFRTVNAAGLYSTPCPDAQVYVKASAALSLMVDKSGSDIKLDWTDAASQNNYRVMRGTSPQVMTQIQSTAALDATDAGAANGPVCYFYSIDTPQ